MRKFTLLLAIFFIGLQAYAQKVVTGTVTSADDGNTMPGVSVLVKGTTVGTVTDVDGKYSLKVPESGTTLVFSFVGMTTVEQPISGNVVDAQLKAEDNLVNEVVVTGYGVQKKREVTGSIAQVKGSDIAEMATPSFDAVLQGKSSGVQISTTSGILGQTPDIKIRGTNSITSGTYPLVVVDGIPIFTQNLVTSGNGASTNALGDINPADIESIEVLKDGSATAIYGSRAANGVILITTKKGSQGKFRLNYGNYMGFAQTVKRYDLLNADEWITVQNEKLANTGNPANAVAMDGVNTDWQKVVFRDKAFQQDHNLSLTGSTEKTSYYVSMGFASQEGITVNNSMKRYSYRMNLDQKIKKWVSVGTNIGVTRSELDGLNTGTNSLSGNVYAATKLFPNVPVMDPNNPTGYNIDAASNVIGQGNNKQGIGTNIPNIKYVLDNNTQYTNSWRIIGNLYTDLSFLQHFKYRFQVSIDSKIAETGTYWNPIHGDGKSQKGYLNQTYEPGNRWNVQNILNYNQSFGKHNLSATLVSELQKTKYSYFTATATNISDQFFNQNIISGTFSQPNAGGFMADNGFVSFAGRFNYNFASKYFLQASVRRDAISSLPEDNRFGLFPGFSAGWTVSEESFFKDNIRFISDLKIRGSYAEVGNTSIGNYPYLGTYGAAVYGNSNGLAFRQMGNSDLKWETSKKLDIGFDLALLGGKYRLNFDYYKNDQSGLIMNVPTPPSLGVPYSEFSKNIGSCINKGIELGIDANLYSSKDLSVNFSGNLSINKNELTSLVDGSDIIPLNNAYIVNRVGESISALYGFTYGGVNPSNGNPLWVKADGTVIQYLPVKTGTINSGFYVYDAANPNDYTTASALESKDRKILGESLPTYFGSFSFLVKYKSFDLSVMFRYSGGNKIFNKTREELLSMQFVNNGSEILERWQSVDNPGNGEIPKLYSELQSAIFNIGSANTLFLEKGDYVRLQSLKLSYTVPQAVLSKYFIDNVRVFVQGQNLFTMTKYKGLDPDMSGNVFTGVDYNGNPLQRVITFGINLGF